MSKILGPEFGYVDLLDHGTTQASIEEEAKIKSGESRPKVLRPSSAGKCSRELAYGLMEQTGQAYYDKDIRDPNVTRLLRVGHDIERGFIEQFKMYAKDYFKLLYEQQSVIGFKVESKKYPELLTNFIEGSIDWVFEGPDGVCIADAKSKKNKFHSYFKDDWDATTDKLLNMTSVITIAGSNQAFWIEDLEAFIKELDDPFFEQNYWQLNFYANTDWAKQKKVTHACILQYNKNDSRVREIRFKPSAALYEKVRLRFQAAVDAADNGNIELAPKEFNYGSIKCAFCPYKEECWKEKDKDALQAFFDMNYHKKRWPTDIQKIDGAGIDVIKELEGHYKIIQEADALSKEREKAEGAIVTFMLDKGLKKIRFRDKKVYEIRYLKSGRPNYQLRRGKA